MGEERPLHVQSLQSHRRRNPLERRQTRDGTEVTTAPMIECNAISVVIRVIGQAVFRVAVAVNVGFRLSEGVGAAAVDPRGCENSASSSSSTPTAVSKAPRPAIRAGPVVRGALQGRRSRYMQWAKKRNNNDKIAPIARLLPATGVLPRAVFFDVPSS